MVLGERYELLDRIGSGGMADVFSARDRLLDRMVAVKVLHSQFANDASFVSRFQHEAQGAAKLSHPNIVSIYDVGEDGGSHYIVMELVTGSTLKEKIASQGHLTVEESLRMAGCIASALEAAHAKGLVHCDIKPHNILIADNGSVKVADFGIARAVSSSAATFDGNVVGSVHYLSPEQAKGTSVTTKSDIYSLGVVLFEMLTGRVPFTGETPVSVALKQITDPVPSLRSFDPTIPMGVDAIVQRMMSKDPSMRPSARDAVMMIREAQGRFAPEPVNDPYATQVLPAARVARAANQMENRDDTSKPLYKSKKFVFFLVIILIAGFFTGAFLSFGKFWSSEEIVVPDVTGKQMALAKQILESKKLRVEVAETYDADVPAGEVVSQTPEAGTKVKEDRLVTIYVSKGGEEMSMPDLRSLTRESAEERLEKLGLKIGSVTERYSDEKKGTVISQDPRAGSKIHKGQTVDLVISKGEKEDKSSVPDVTGASLDSARSALAAAGYNVGSITEQVSSQHAGTVIRQSPGANSKAAKGTYINLVIAKSGAADKSGEKGHKAPNPDSTTGKTK